MCRFCIFPRQDERSFSDVEESKLQAALDLSAQDLQLVLHANEFFLQQVGRLRK